MVWLKTFGGAVLYDDEQQPIGGAARHRRTIGLLTVLAVAGEAGLTRDKLIGVFWPDFDQKRARHSLTQALYAARRATGHDDLFDAGEDVQLNFDCFGCDVRDFDELLSRDDDEAAFALYHGPFLDGFFLQSQEFDNWQAQERVRFEDRAVAAANRVVTRAEGAGDLAKATEHARRINTIRPTDAGAVITLMRLLAVRGDRPAALLCADQYVALMREQYEIEPNPAVLEYAQSLKQVPLPLAVSVLVPPAGVRPMPAAVAEAAALQATAMVPVPPERRARRTLLWLVGAFVAVVAAIAAVKSLSRQPQVAWSATEPRTLIAPFRVRVTDPALGYLGNGMIELLATRLADDSVDRAMDAATIIRAWGSADVVPDAEIPLAKIVTVARKLGAERVVVGSVVGNPDHLIISASLINVASQEIATRASVEGAVDTLAMLVDELARKLLLSQIDPGESLTERLTVSLPALRAHVRGTAAYASADYALAQRFYARALSLDSTFALAALKLAVAAGRMADFEAQRVALDRAWQQQHHLSDKDRAFLFAELGPRYPSLSSLAEQVATWSQAARLAPERAEVWAGLAGALNERRRAASETADTELIIAALERALELDAGHVGASLLLAHVRPDQPLFERAGESAVALGSKIPFVAWWRSILQQPGERRSADSLETLGPANLRAIALAGQYMRGGRHDSKAALRLLLAKAASADEAMTLLVAQHSFARNENNDQDAYEATRRMQRTRPVGRAHLRLRVLDALYDRGDTAIAAAAVERLEATPSVPGGAADMCVSAQWYIARGDLDKAREALTLLQRQGRQFPLIASVQPRMCAPFVSAAIAVASQSDVAVSEVQALDSLAFTNTGAGDLAAYANIALAQVYRRLNLPAQALAAIRRRPIGAAVWPRYLTAALRVEQELCATPQLAPQCSSRGSVGLAQSTDDGVQLTAQEQDNRREPQIKQQHDDGADAAVDDVVISEVGKIHTESEGEENP